MDPRSDDRRRDVEPGEDAEALEELTLLVIDDDPDLRLYVRQCVSGGPSPFRRVVEASDGESGLALLHAERPDVLVCDILMPRLDGFAFCERLRADPSTAGIPLLLLTGSATSAETFRRAEHVGADGVLLKPFNARSLRAAVRDAIRTRSAIRARADSRQDLSDGANRRDSTKGEGR